MITILGPTATGKTKLAAAIAAATDGEIISADSRQIYRGMDIGTGKDINDYVFNGKPIPYHLIDIADPGYEYNVFEFQKHFVNAYNAILKKGKTPILCGGTGMYIESVLKGYKLIKVPDNNELRKSFENKTDLELIEELKNLKKGLHNISDITERKRVIRAIEIERYYNEHPEIDHSFPKIENTTFGIHFEREVIRKRITERLLQRLEEGMIQEVENLLSQNITPDQLRFYGLEYRYLTDYVTGEIDYNTMFTKLNTAIHQFAKRQSTWFRRMEKHGIKINWIDGNLSTEDKLIIVGNALKSFGR